MPGVLQAALLGVFMFALGMAIGAWIIASHDEKDMRHARANSFICGADWAFWQPDQHHQFGKKCDGELVNAYINGGLIDLVREGRFP